MDKLAIFSGNAHPELAKDIAKYLKVKLSEALVTRFSEGEIRVKINENVRGKDVFVVQPTCPPSNENLMELLIMMDALKRASAREVNVVIPYYGYSRQDRKVKARQPISAKLVADLIQVSGATRVICMDLHAAQIQGFFNIPIDNFRSLPIIASYLNSKGLSDLVVVSPDHGGVARARALADALSAPIAIIDKTRPEPNVAEVMNIIGRVKGKNCIVFDDMIDTG
ncbi:MAG: ribose-phosphate diphosphokinase, partial [Candidatus Omnitrophota bacterium]